MNEHIEQILKTLDNVTDLLVVMDENIKLLKLRIEGFEERLNLLENKNE